MMKGKKQLVAMAAVLAILLAGGALRAEDVTPEAAGTPDVAEVTPAEPGAPAKVGNPSLIVLPLAPQGVPDTVAKSLTELLALELEKTNRWEVISQEDLKAMLDQEALKQLMGTDTDETQVAKVGMRLNTDYMLRGTVGKVGATYMLALTLVNSRTATVDRRVNQTLTGKPDALIGSLQSAVVALALEEKGVAPDITEELINGLNISRKKKTLFLHLRVGYELPVGNLTDESDLAYMLPGLMEIRLSAGTHVLPWLQVVAESGIGLSVAEQFAMQTSVLYLRNYDGAMDSGTGVPKIDQEAQVSTATFDFSTMRVPLNLMVRFQPATGRLLPFFQTGIGFSWQRYHMGNEKVETLYGDKDIATGGVCPDPYSKVGSGNCLRVDTLYPNKFGQSDTRSYFNLQVPVGVGVDYLLTHNIGIGVEARYQLTYSLNKDDNDLKFKAYSERIDYTNEAGEDIIEYVGDVKPVRRLHHGISVTGGMFYYF